MSFACGCHMQKTCKLQWTFNKSLELFNTCFSEFTEGWTNPNICVYNFNFQPLQQPPQHTTRQISGKLLVLCVFLFQLRLKLDLVFLRCLKTSIQSFPLNKILKDWILYVVFGRDYGHYPAQFEANIMAFFFPLYCTLRKEGERSGYTNIVKNLHIPCMSIYCGQIFTLKCLDLVSIRMIFFLFLNFHLHNEYSSLWLCSQSTCLV
jgi:hypothetical protein